MALLSSARLDHRQFARDQQLRRLVEPARPFVAGIDGLLDGARRPAVANPRDRGDPGFLPAIAQLLEQIIVGQPRRHSHQRIREELGGLDGLGLPLAKGAALSYRGESLSLREVPLALRPDLKSNAALDLVLGAQIGQFSGQSLFDVFNTTWAVDSRADRMGIRLLGSALHYQGQPMISEGIPLGAVQVPPDGQPIVLLNDRQTIGGYPRLGALTPLALARLAQCLPGTQVRLKQVVQDVAHREQVEYLRRFVNR